MIRRARVATMRRESESSRGIGGRGLSEVTNSIPGRARTKVHPFGAARGSTGRNGCTDGTPRRRRSLLGDFRQPTVATGLWAPIAPLGTYKLYANLWPSPIATCHSSLRDAVQRPVQLSRELHA